MGEFLVIIWAYTYQTSHESKDLSSKDYSKSSKKCDTIFFYVDQEHCYERVSMEVVNKS